jgi:hypothetical protein
VRACGCRPGEYCRVCENIPQLDIPWWAIAGVLLLVVICAMTAGCGTVGDAEHSPANLRRCIAGLAVLSVGAMGAAHMTSSIHISPPSTDRQKSWIAILGSLLLVLLMTGCRPHQIPGQPCGHVREGSLMCAVGKQGECREVLVSRAFPRPAATAIVQYEGFMQPVEIPCANLW